MIHKGVATFLLGVSIANSVYATPLLRNLISPKALTSVTQKAQKNQSNQVYTDFSGTWESSRCLGSSLTLKIVSSPTELTVNDDEPMSIGTMMTKSNSGIKSGASIMTGNETTSIEWNATKTQLIIKNISINKSFTDEDSANGGADTHMYLTMNHVVFALDNEQLKIQMNTADYEDLQRVDESHPTCVFNKVG
ncbi:hypothetical protein [Legionella maioricensis]|uniref:Uncharacterized protein n=1 Tax=Legionella maioricensis TaxID=2896528 RepID=A0A9X2CZH0_9GAMM|nr:hypothetical protein [Legionella maioricensis]MCL9683606.1 hypothetical protein [Legionella maioricensis]MCL9687628.1 hypothetical protein [Legionella maioricensis]